MRIDEENQKIQITANQVQWAGKVEISKVIDFFHWNSKSKGQKRAWVSPSKGEMMSPDKGYQGSPLLDSSLKWSFFRLYPHTSLNISKLEINYSSWCHIIKLINPYFTIKDHQHQRWRSCGKGFWSPGGKTHKVTVSRPTIWSDFSGIW